MRQNFFITPRRRVLLIYTGGTIGMIKNPETGALETYTYEHLQRHVPELRQFDYIIRDYPFNPPIDSSDMEPALWAKLVRIIRYNYNAFDGFVILHGTDTMAYTASALSFMLEGLAKPVVLTGSQLPIGVVRTDGRENLINAIEFAAACDEQLRPCVPEVCVCFGGKLFRGNRCTKRDAGGFSAFTSYNHPPLAETGLQIRFHHELILRPAEDTPFKPDSRFDDSVIAITLFPGLHRDILDAVFAFPRIKGIVLRTFGSGNAPRRPWLLESMRRATDAGKVIVNITQCQKGDVDMWLYETGRQLLEVGVVSGRNMTIECAVTKLMCLFGRQLAPRRVRELMCQPLAGELG